MSFSTWMAKIRQSAQPVLRLIDHRTKNITQKAATYITNNKRTAIIAAAGVVLTIGGGVTTSAYYDSQIIPIYHVALNGKEVGVVNSPEVVQKWEKEKLQKEQAKHSGLSLKLSDYISFTEERVYKGEFNNEATLKALDQIAQVKVEAAKIIVNNEVIGYAASQEQAEQALSKIKEKYSGVSVNPSGKKAVAAASLESATTNSAIKQVKFKEDIRTETEAVPAAQVYTVDKLEAMLSKGTFQQVVHNVEEGDCITCIAKRYGITSKDIYANNPGITENTVLQLGQPINVTAVRPMVTVQVVEELTQDEMIDYATENRTNEKVPKGETKVLQEGKEGKKQVRYQIIRENGQIIDRQILEQKVISQPITKIVERGSKVILSRGTGRLSWPAGGYISSGFGSRWGRLHAGLDIAGGGVVRAADNGRVVEAGWHGGYGNMIVVDHGNGLQTLYGHLSKINVRVGDVVPQGKVIGVKGSTGNSTGVHLHFEVRKNGSPQNPMKYLGR
ncbi:MAG: peptidoglycan DD-metalloendopeptidase family protein [Clostridia bacterium]